MTKQDEIREGMYQIINNYTRGLVPPTRRRKLRDALLKYEDSKGVVIRIPNGADLTGCELARLLPLVKE
ncbi:unnamed protein product [marine sediment metagenome]|uniref:Uncharacterized protein n=1 Tax=marine sediment metagenome TaxID=412755 RepID=X0X5R9_9ZZZZ